PGIMTGKCVFLGGSTDMETNAHGIKTGDLSAIVTPLIRWPLTQIYLPGKQIALMSHWPSKIQAIAEACIDQDVRMISGMASWGLVLLEKVLELARSRGRKADCIRDVWPNWTLFVHGGVKYTPFQPRVAKAWSGDPKTDVPYRLELYPASEGFIALQDTRADPGLRLCSDVWNFYEFVPLEEIDSPNPRAFMAHEVEKGQKYVVTMSTCAGLWRYVIGDVVEFDTICAAPESIRGGDRGYGDGPSRLRIVGRHRHFINAFGENLIVENVENAAAAAAAATGLEIGEFTAGPVYPTESTRAGHEVVVEMATVPAGPMLERFADAYDKGLMAGSVDYGIKRTGALGMQPPTATVVPLGTFHQWMASRGKLGGQNKVPRCANHRDFVDGVSAMGRAAR
ncbi:MAG: GH3 auxin-responsive promoter family protein, partial [Phycisphaerales bacterium]|nr:GH3 auxin-responsive promoter family protein [Phycisphaerales bacterium]